MNEKKLQIIASQQTSVATTVLEAVPIAQPWPVSMICSELQRLGKNYERRTITGCLRSLCESGLIRQPSQGEFIRVTAKTKHKEQVQTLRAIINGKQEEKTVAEKPVKPEPKPEPMERLAIAARSSRELAEKLRLMANELEEIALDVDERFQKVQADTAKLRQLQELLKALGQ